MVVVLTRAVSRSSLLTAKGRLWRSESGRLAKAQAAFRSLRLASARVVMLPL